MIRSPCPSLAAAAPRLGLRQRPRGRGPRAARAHRHRGSRGIRDARRLLRRSARARRVRPRLPHRRQDRRAPGGRRRARAQGPAPRAPRSGGREARRARGARAQLASAESELALAKAELERAADLLAKQVHQPVRLRRAAEPPSPRPRRGSSRRARRRRSPPTRQAYTTLAADADGVVISVSAEPGQVRGRRPARAAPRARRRDGNRGQRPRGPGGALPPRPGRRWSSCGPTRRNRFPGRVREIAGGADAVTRTFAVRVSVPRAPPQARVGMSATVALAAARRRGPRRPAAHGARARGRGGLRVGRGPEDLARAVARRAGGRSSARTARPSSPGSPPGTIVVSAGVHKLRAGQPVRVRAPPRAARRRAEGAADGPPLQPLGMGARAPHAGALPHDRARRHRRGLLPAPRARRRTPTSPSRSCSCARAGPAPRPTRSSASSPTASRRSCRRRRAWTTCAATRSPGESVVFVFVKDSSRPDEIKDTWYQVRKKVGDIRGQLPAGIQGPFFNDEFGDTFGNIYALTGDGFSYAQLKEAADRIRADLLRVKDVAKVDLIGEQDEKIFVEVANAKLATLGRRARRGLRRARAAERGGLLRQLRDRHRPHLHPHERRPRLRGERARAAGARQRPRSSAWATSPPSRAASPTRRSRRCASWAATPWAWRCPWPRAATSSRWARRSTRRWQRLQAELPVGSSSTA